MSWVHHPFWRAQSLKNSQISLCLQKDQRQRGGRRCHWSFVPKYCKNGDLTTGRTNGGEHTKFSIINIVQLNGPVECFLRSTVQENYESGLVLLKEVERKPGVVKPTTLPSKLTNIGWISGVGRFLINHWKVESQVRMQNEWKTWRTLFSCITRQWRPRRWYISSCTTWATWIPDFSNGKAACVLYRNVAAKETSWRTVTWALETVQSFFNFSAMLCSRKSSTVTVVPFFFDPIIVLTLQVELSSEEDVKDVARAPCNSYQFHNESIVPCSFTRRDWDESCSIGRKFWVYTVSRFQVLHIYSTPRHDFKLRSSLRKIVRRWIFCPDRDNFCWAGGF